jgi:hypothetical protein
LLGDAKIFTSVLAQLPSRRGVDSNSWPSHWISASAIRGTSSAIAIKHIVSRGKPDMTLLFRSGIALSNLDAKRRVVDCHLRVTGCGIRSETVWRS